jgi:hypothetical protein
MAPKIMYDNLISDEDYLTASSDRPGIVTNVIKEGTGGAIMQSLGDYTGNLTNQYTIEIDSIAGGQNVGEATFSWIDSFGNGGDGILTSTSETSLNYGVSIQFVESSSDDFELGDKWYFKAINYYRPGQMINYDRDTRYRSSGLDNPNWIEIDFGSAQSITCFCLIDHNFTDSAIVTLQANDNSDSTAWDSPPFEEVLTVDGQTIYKVFSAVSYRYWRLEIDDNGNPDAYIEIGEIFLGNQLTINDYKYGDNNNRSALLSNDRVRSGVRKIMYHNTNRVISIVLNNPSESDRDTLWDLFDSISSKANMQLKPFFLYINSALYYVILDEIPSRSYTYNVFSISLTFDEVLTSRT